MRSLARIVAFFLAFLLSVPSHAAEERILSFDSVIRVDPDGGVTVTEEITVVALGREIRRGIYRELPLPATGIKVLAVLKNGEPEPWFTESGPNSIRIYMGQKDVFLEHGDYTYSLTYREAGQISSFSDYDKLYWNVTGNGWGFTIEQASATVILPRGGKLAPRQGLTIAVSWRKAV
jgi:hypothetical protein